MTWAITGVSTCKVAGAAEIDGVIVKGATKSVIVYAIAITVDHDAVVCRAADRGIMNIAVAAVELDNRDAAVFPGIGSAVDLPVSIVALSQG